MKNWPVLSQRNRLCYIISVWRRFHPTFAIVPIILVSKVGDQILKVRIAFEARVIGMFILNLLTHGNESIHNALSKLSRLIHVTDKALQFCT